MIPRSAPVRALSLVLLAAGAVGCAADAARREDVSHALEQGAGGGLRPLDDEDELPPGVDLADGITEDEAAAAALWRNPGFLGALADLEVGRAEVYQAGLFRDPALAFLFPLGPKQYEWTLSVPLQDLWQRPQRVSAAQAEAERIAERLVQDGLDLVRDVRAAHAAWVLARERADLAQEQSAVQAELAELATRRLATGEVSPVEARAAAAAADRARQGAVRLSAAARAAEGRFWAALGFEDAPDCAPVAEPPESGSPPPEEELRRQAFASRPDLRAAELAVEAAGERVGLARSEAFRLSLLIDANENGTDGFEMGPGLLGSIPIFSGSRGTSAVARANLERTALRYAALRQQIALEVLQASIDLEQSQRAQLAWSEEIVPELREVVRIAEASLAVGEVAPMAVLRARLDLLDAQVRLAEAEFELRRARAELERCVGGRPAEGAEPPAADPELEVEP
jgi:cobalt-zinc-cadmium efflux system outer membrane protein